MNETVGKRINITEKNIKRIKIIGTVLEEEYSEMSEKDKLNAIINKAIENFYSSDEIKEKLEL